MFWPRTSSWGRPAITPTFAGSSRSPRTRCTGTCRRENTPGRATASTRAAPTRQARRAAWWGRQLPARPPPGHGEDRRGEATSAVQARGPGTVGGALRPGDRLHRHQLQTGEAVRAVKYLVALAGAFLAAVLTASLSPYVRVLGVAPDFVLIFAPCWAR